ATLEYIDTENIQGQHGLLGEKIFVIDLVQQELAGRAYDKIEWHTINIEDLNQRLQNISDTVVKMDERWDRSDEATRSFMAAWFRDESDKVDSFFPTRSCLFTD